jgi:DNA polymerase epsilon subunit 1
MVVKSQHPSVQLSKRLAEFLGDQVVKDAGLSCRKETRRYAKLLLDNKWWGLFTFPLFAGALVTDRAIPLAIFQSEPSVKRHYLKKMVERQFHDGFWHSHYFRLELSHRTSWRLYPKNHYYPCRLANCKALLSLYPGSIHPDWLHKWMLEKNDVLKQRRIDEIFKVRPI